MGGEWFVVRMRRQTASRFQALRAMMRFLFRIFCSDPTRWKELVSAGQVGEKVFDLAAQIIRADFNRQSERVAGGDAAGSRRKGAHPNGKASGSSSSTVSQ